VSRDQRSDPYGRNIGFLDRSSYFFFQVAPELYSRGWVGPVPVPLLRKSCSVGNRTRNSGSVARNSDHYTTEAVTVTINTILKNSVQIFDISSAGFVRFRHFASLSHSERLGVVASIFLFLLDSSGFSSQCGIPLSWMRIFTPLLRQIFEIEMAFSGHQSKLSSHATVSHRVETEPWNQLRSQPVILRFLQNWKAKRGLQQFCGHIRLILAAVTIM
jgi:hypothetical protein